MPRFHYVALDARGQENVGQIEASNQTDAVGQLRRSGYFPTSVVEEGKGGGGTPPKVIRRSGAPAAAAAKARTGPNGAAARSDTTRLVLVKSASVGGRNLGRRVAGRALMIFTRQLATLIDAGLPLLRGLTVLEKQERDPGLKATVAKLAESVQGGSTFSESLAQHPKIFNKLYVNMVRAGELGGVLELVLNRLAEFQEKAAKVRNRVKAAMIYPVVVLTIAVGITFFLLTVIVPKFELIFQDMLNGRPLPVLTQLVIEFSRFCQAYWWAILGGAALGFGAYAVFAARPAGRVILDRLFLRAPLFGDLIRKGAISRFARTLGTLVTSGVPILQALNITRETAGNAVIAHAIGQVHDAVREGERIVEPLEASRVFPPMVISMIDVGEETGRLPEMLLKIAEVYDDEVDNAVAGLTSLLEPVMIVLLAVIVGTIVIALFLPLISIIGGMQEQH